MGYKCVLRKFGAHLLRNILFGCKRNIVIQCILDEICSLEVYRLVYLFCDQNKMMQLGWLLVSASPSFIIRFHETIIQPVDCAVWSTLHIGEWCSINLVTAYAECVHTVLAVWMRTGVVAGFIVSSSGHLVYR